MGSAGSTHSFFARGVDRHWNSMLRDAKSKVLVFSPYLTGPTALNVLQNVVPSQCEVHAVCSVENFVAGASTIQTFRRLIERGYKLFHVDALHAKVVLVVGQSVTIGSQNLTAGGRRNLEVTVAFSSTDDAKELQRLIASWLDIRRQISLEELDEIEPQIRPLKRQWKALTRKILEVQRSAAESRHRREAAKRERDATIANAEEQIRVLVESDGVSREVAQQFVRKSAYWDHPKSKGLVGSPGDASNVRGTPGDWFVYSGNQFLISRAIRRCSTLALTAISSARAGKPPSEAVIREQMRDEIRMAVSRFDGQEYKGFISPSKGLMWFGSHVIDVDEFLDEFFAQSGIHEAFKAAGIG